jgi:outer membrane murein-binding lipoprotein Lpp
MSDYLRARIDALEREVNQLRNKVEFLSAQLEVAKEAMFNDKYQKL